MARSVQWRRTCNDLVFWRQCQALNATIYILREVGPTGFLLKEEGESKPCKAFLGDPHSCTCAQFMKDQDLCKHICWLILKKFRVPQTNPISWQKGLVEREINDILRGLAAQQQKKPPVSRWLKREKTADGREALQQREIGEDDVCPICQDELLAKHLPVTFCKFGCGNSIHIKCMKVWAEHQKSQGETTVKCPFCREDFGPIELLKQEDRNASGPIQGGRMDRHIGVKCECCQMFPIEGKCYRCSSCANYHLCQSCFNTPIHTQHGFEFRHKRNQRWRAAQRAYGAVLPQAVVDDLVNREISDTDYDLLMQLDSNAQAPLSDIPEEVIQTFPLEKVRETSALRAPGIQCRVCLRGYEVGQFIRKLPRCKHKFHRDCIDNWLLHSKPTCPIDGQVVWDPISAQLENEEQNRGDRRPKRAKQDNQARPANQLDLQIPGVGLAIRSQDDIQQERERDRQDRRQQRLRRPPDRADREAQRILGLRSNFSLSGTAVAGAQDDLSTNLPGGNLLNRANARRNSLNQRLNSLDVHIPQENDVSQNGMDDTEIENDNVNDMDIINQVADLNSFSDNQSHDQGQRSMENGVSDSTADPSQSNFIHNQTGNPSALFGQQTNPHFNATNALLANIERLSQYREMPSMLDTLIERNQMRHGDNPNSDLGLNLGESDSVSPETQSYLENSARVPRLFSNSAQNGAEVEISMEMLRGNNPSNVTVPRLFQQSGAEDAAGETTTTQHRAGETTTSQQRGISLQEMVLNIRSANNVASAPASLDGRERGRSRDRGWAQQQSVAQRKRSGSRDHNRERSASRDRNQQRNDPSIPKEGQNLLNRLQMFSDLYLGNSPRSHPPPRGQVAMATSLPPRPPQRQLGNHAAARRRRFENDRKKNEFSLEGSAYKGMTLRDLL